MELEEVSEALWFEGECKEFLGDEAGKKVRLEILRSRYCDKCKKFLRMIDGNFQDDQGTYRKARCDSCDEIKKIRNYEKLEELDGN